MSQGARPDIILQASDGNFYGAAQVTDEGVSNPQGGTLFKLTPAGKFTQLFTFTQGSGGFLKGNNPADGFVEANDGFLYGTTFNGGKNNDGVLFRTSKTGTGFKVLHNFCSSAKCTDGSIPREALITHYACFGGFSIFHYDYKRNQTSIRETHKFQPPACLVKDQMIWQAEVFEMRAK